MDEPSASLLRAEYRPWLIGGAVLLAGCLLLQRAPPAEGALPLAADAPDMLAVFSCGGADGKTDAYRLGAVAEKQANALRAEYALPPGQRCLGRSGDVVRLRVATIDVMHDGRSFSERYGERFQTAVNTFFDRRVGARDGALTDGQWLAWIAALDDFAAANRAAGERL